MEMSSGVTSGITCTLGGPVCTLGGPVCTLGGGTCTLGGVLCLAIGGGLWRRSCGGVGTGVGGTLGGLEMAAGQEELALSEGVR